MILDFAKIIADLLNKPLVTVPTSSATCCAYTPMSVCYTPQGQTAGSRNYSWSIAAVLADMDILSRQPPRLLVAGACDALAKKIEIEQRMRGRQPSELDPGFAACYALADYIYGRILAELDEAAEDCRNRRNTKRLYDMVYYSIVGAGVVSGLAKGARQTAVGHKFYLYIRTAHTVSAASWLHGELVAIGLIAQLVYNGQYAQALEFRDLLRRLKLPDSFPALGIARSATELADCYEFIRNSSAMREAGPDDLERLRRGLELIIPSGSVIDKEDRSSGKCC